MDDPFSAANDPSAYLRSLMQARQQSAKQFVSQSRPRSRVSPQMIHCHKFRETISRKERRWSRSGQRSLVTAGLGALDPSPPAAGIA
jgi:hypothetical protein